MDNRIDRIWDFLVEYGICSNESIALVVAINGYNEDTMNDVIYATTGYRNFEQLQGDYL